MGQPRPSSCLFGEVDQNRLRIGNRDVAIDEYGHLAFGIERQVIRSFVCARAQIKGNQLVGLIQDIQEQTSLITIAGKFKVIEFHDHAS